MRSIFPALHRMKGAVAVELALLILPLVMLVLATVDFARAMFVYDQLLKATRDGARYLSFFDPTVAAEYPVDLAKTRMIYGSTSTNAPKVIPGLEKSMISICDRVDSSACSVTEAFANVPAGSGSINLVKVTISGFQYQSIFPGVSNMISITFEPISVTMRQLY